MAEESAVGAVLGKITEGAAEKYAEFLEKFAKNADVLVKPVSNLDEFVKDGGLDSFFLVNTKLEMLSFGINKVISGIGGLTTALRTLGIDGKNITAAIADIQNGMKSLYGVTEQETQIFDTLQKMMMGQTTGFGTFAKILTAASDEVQKFNVELTKIGRNDEVAANIIKTSKNLDEMAISYDEVKSATIEYIKASNLSIRIDGQKNQQFENSVESMTELIAINKKFGIDYNSTVGVINMATNAMHGNSQTVEDINGGLIKFAQITGQDANTVFKEFTQTLDKFSYLSAEKAVKQFERLEAFSKRTGQNISTIIQGLEGFDDISQGQEKLGKMNRLLMQLGGAPIDPQKFLTASQEDKEKMLVESLASIQNISGFQDSSKRLIISELTKTFGMNAQTISELTQGDIAERISRAEQMKKALSAAGEYGELTDAEKTRLSVGLTTAKEIQKGRDQQIQRTESAQKLAIRQREAALEQSKQSAKMYEKLDEKIFDKVINKDIGGLMRGVADAFKELGQEMASKLKDINMDNAGDKLIDAAGALTKAATHIIDLSDLPAPSQAMGTGVGTITPAGATSAREMSDIALPGQQLTQRKGRRGTPTAGRRPR